MPEVSRILRAVRSASIAFVALQLAATADAQTTTKPDPTFAPPPAQIHGNAKLVNSSDVQAAILENYPSLMRSARIGGTTALWLYIDEKGAVTDQRIRTSSGYDAFDNAALKVATSMRFEPATINGRARRAWVEAPVEFIAPAASQAEPITASTPIARPPSTTTGGGFTPDTPGAVRVPATRPKLLNQTEVEKAISRAFPPSLRSRRISGTAVAWYFVDETGHVSQSRIARSSGYAEFDEAALKIGDVFRFTPAQYKGKPYPVWVQIPVVFTVH